MGFVHVTIAGRVLPQRRAYFAEVLRLNGLLKKTAAFHPREGKFPLKPVE